MCLCVCALASDSSDIIEVIIIKLGTAVTASDLRMHHVLIILTLTLTQGHTDLNCEHNNCSIIEKLFEQMNAHQVFL